MTMLRRWQAMHGLNMNVDLSSFMALCGNGVVKAHELGGVCISFGCPDSREYACVRDGEMVVAMPFELARSLF